MLSSCLRARLCAIIAPWKFPFYGNSWYTENSCLYYYSTDGLNIVPPAKPRYSSKQQFRQVFLHLKKNIQTILILHLKGPLYLRLETVNKQTEMKQMLKVIQVIQNMLYIGIHDSLYVVLNQARPG